jgi:hypothetical protein
VGSALGAAALAFGLFIAVAFLSRQFPDWWRGIETDRAVLAAIGADMENAIVEEVSRVRPGAPDAGPPGPGWHSEDWTLEIRDDEAIAWLNTRFPKWLANRAPGLGAPEEVRQLQVAFEANAVRLGVAIEVGGAPRVVWLTLHPSIDAQGRLWIPATGVGAGRLPLPRSWLGEGTAGAWLPKQASSSPEVLTLLRALAGGEPAAAKPVMSLGDGRSVRLVAVRVEDGRLVLTCRTESGNGGG